MKQRSAILLLAVLPLLAGCTASTAAPATVPSVSVAAAHGDAFTRLLAGFADRGLAPTARNVSFLLLLRDPGAAKRAANLAALYDPRSPKFGHFQTPAQAAADGPNPAGVTRIVSYLHRQGLEASWQHGDTWLNVSGPAGTVSRVFHTAIHRYRTPSGAQVIAALHDPRVPAALAGLVTGAGHIASTVWLHARAVPAGGLKPGDMLRAYNVDPLRNQKLTGAGETVVFFEIDGFRQADLDAYAHKYGLPAFHVTVKGPKLTPGGEAPMDIEAVHAIAPGAKLVVYNLNQDQLANNSNSDAEFESAMVGFQRKIVNENPHAIVSNSVGGCANVLGRSVSTAMKTIFDRADALGEAWFAASGDNGAFDCLPNLEQTGDPPAKRDVGVDIPASLPGVTGVGGTMLDVRTDGRWYREAAWEGPVETSGGGGGISSYFSRPGYQNAPGVFNKQLNPKSMRSVPDVSAVADPISSGTYQINGRAVREGGTSQAAPFWAGIMALIDQYLHKNGGRRLGFANPALYTVARAKAPYPAFHDVIAGNNLLYPAGKGYDMATGLGTPDAWNLARDLLRYEKGSLR